MLIFCLVGLLSFDETANKGRELAKSGSNQKKFNAANLILMSIGKSGIIKFEFQTTWIGFIVSDLIYIPTTS